MVTNADGTVSLVGLDTTQLDQLLHFQGYRCYVLSSYFMGSYQCNSVVALLSTPVSLSNSLYFVMLFLGKKNDDNDHHH